MTKSNKKVIEEWQKVIDTESEGVEIVKIQVEVCDDYDTNVLRNMNDFMEKHDVVDVKMNTVIAVTGQFFTRYLVIYRKH